VENLRNSEKLQDLFGTTGKTGTNWKYSGGGMKIGKFAQPCEIMVRTETTKVRDSSSNSGWAYHGLSCFLLWKVVRFNLTRQIHDIQLEPALEGSIIYSTSHHRRITSTHFTLLGLAPGGSKVCVEGGEELETYQYSSSDSRSRATRSVPENIKMCHQSNIVRLPKGIRIAGVPQ